MKLDKLIAVDLFSGCGGLSLGLERASFDVVAGVEINEIASGVYRANHRNTNMLVDDIQNVNPSDLKKLLPEGRLHLLAGCAPCQGFCSLTAKIRREDPRNKLVLEMIKFAEALEPDVIFMENVPGLINRGKEIMNELTKGLRKLGYYCETHIVQMADYGVPQNRRRLVMLGGRGFIIPLPSPTHARVADKNADLKPWVSLRQAIHGHKAPVKLTKSWRSGGPQAFNWHIVRDLKKPTLQRLRAAMPGKSWLSVNEQLRPRCHQGNYGGFTNVYGRMTWDAIAVTMTAGCTVPCKGRFGHPDRRRTTISVREAASIQTFPESYVFNIDKIDAVCSMIGNAVPPMFARVVGDKIANTIREHHAALARKCTI